jgi:hypothetical protein
LHPVTRTLGRLPTATKQEPPVTTATNPPKARSERISAIRNPIVQAINERVPGTVTLHYASRDIAITATGDTALRMMIAFRRQRADLPDPIVLGQTLALTGWTTISHGDLLAITWDPGECAEEAVGAELLDLLTESDTIVRSEGSCSRQRRPGP